jgi:adenylate cyclase
VTQTGGSDEALSGKLHSCVVLFVDISGSSRLYQELGDAAASRRVRDCLDRLRQVVHTYEGRVIKNMGDGLMCHFAEAHHALEAAAAMHIAVHSQSDHTGPNLGIHVGCHFGQVLERAGDPFGDTVNIAARVANVARAGQIIATRETIERLDDTLEMNARLLNTVSVKGRRDAITVFEYLWHRHGDLTFKGDQPAPTLRIPRLKLTFDGRDVYLDASGTGALSLGRTVTADIPVKDREASRQHATIEMRGDKYVLLDHSSNGTYVASDGASEICLRREEMILPARGRIALGHSTASPQATRVEFLAE